MEKSEFRIQERERHGCRVKCWEVFVRGCLGMHKKIQHSYLKVNASHQNKDNEMNFWGQLCTAAVWKKCNGVGDIPLNKSLYEDIVQMNPYVKLKKRGEEYKTKSWQGFIKRGIYKAKFTRRAELPQKDWGKQTRCPVLKVTGERAWRNQRSYHVVAATETFRFYSCF